MTADQCVAECVHARDQRVQDTRGYVQGTKWCVDERKLFVQDTSMDMSELPSRKMERFRGGLASKAHELLYHSILGSGVRKTRRSKGRA